jgi:hypothetical protein
MFIVWALLELLRLFLSSVCDVFLAFMVIGQQVRSESKASWCLDCRWLLLLDETSPKHDSTLLQVGMAGSEFPPIG